MFQTTTSLLLFILCVFNPFAISLSTFPCVLFLFLLFLLFLASHDSFPPFSYALLFFVILFLISYYSSFSLTRIVPFHFPHDLLLIVSLFLISYYISSFFIVSLVSHLYLTIPSYLPYLSLFLSLRYPTTYYSSCSFFLLFSYSSSSLLLLVLETTTSGDG